MQSIVPAIFPCQAEVTHCEEALVGVEQIGGLEISVYVPLLVHVVHPLQQLDHQLLDLCEVSELVNEVHQATSTHERQHNNNLDNSTHLCGGEGLELHALLEVVLAVLHHHVDLVDRRAHHHLLHTYNIRVLQRKKDVDLS